LYKLLLEKRDGTPWLSKDIKASDGCWHIRDALGGFFWVADYGWLGISCEEIYYDADS